MRIYNMALCMIFIFITTNLALSQGGNNEDVIRKYSTMKDSEAKVDTMIAVAEKLFYHDAKLSMQIFDEASAMANKINYHNGICESHYRKGFLLFDNNLYDKAKTEFELCLNHADNRNIRHKISSLEALAWIEYNDGNFKNAAAYYEYVLNLYIDGDSSDTKLSDIDTKIGNSYLKMNKFGLAQERYLKALEYAIKSNDKSLISSCYVNLGIIKRELHEFAPALKYHNDALKLNREIGDKVKIAVNLANISQVYLDLDSLDIALRYGHDALGIAKQTSDGRTIAPILGVVSEVYMKKKNYSEALNYSRYSLKINKEINNINGIYWDVLNLSNIQLKARTNIEEIRIDLDSVINFAKSNEQLPLLANAYQTMTEYYFYRGTIDSMNYYMELSNKTQEAIFNSNLKNDIVNSPSDLEARLGLQKLQEKVIKLEAKDKEQWTYTYALFLGIVVLFFVSVIVWSERRKSERLLLNVLPKSIATRLKSKEALIADRYESASIVFIDIVQFTLLSRNVDPEDIVELLNNIYTTFDSIAEKHGLEKIKTIGDCYMAVAGAPLPMEDHAHSAAKFAIDAMEKISGVTCKDGTLLEFRCGIDCGPIIAGIIGRKKFIYDLWGDAVNTASRMEEYGESGKIQVTDRFRAALSIDGIRSKVDFVERGEVDIKGKGLMTTYFLEKRADSMN